VTSGLAQPAGAAEPPAPAPRWGVGDALAGYAAGFVLQAFTLSAWVAATGHTKGLGVVAASLAGLWTGLAGAAVLASRRKGSGRLAADFGFRVEPRDVPVGVAVGTLCQFVMVPVLYVPLRLADPRLGRQLSRPAKDLFDSVHGLGFVLLAVLIAVGAPLVEELFFRGLLQRSLERRLGPGWAVGLSAVLFGLAHAEVLQLLALVAFGVVLGVLAQRAGRLGPAIVAHVAFDAATVIVLAASH